MSSERKWPGILAAIDTKTRVMALIALVINAALLATLPFLPAEQRLLALVVCAFVLVVTLIGMFVVELAEAKAKAERDQSPTPDATVPQRIEVRPLVQNVPPFVEKVRKLKDILVERNFLPDLIIGIARSGLAVAGFLAKELGEHRLVPVMSLCRRGDAGFNNSFNRLEFTADEFSGETVKVLIVDEFCRSGRTLNDAKSYVENGSQLTNCDIQTAAIYFYKYEHSHSIQPTFFVYRPEEETQDSSGQNEPYMD